MRSRAFKVSSKALAKETRMVSESLKEHHADEWLRPETVWVSPHKRKDILTIRVWGMAKKAS